MTNNKLQKQTSTYERLYGLFEDDVRDASLNENIESLFAEIKNSEEFMELVRDSARDLSRVNVTFLRRRRLEDTFRTYRECRMSISGHAPIFLETAEQRTEEDYYRRLISDFYDDAVRIRFYEMDKKS